MKYIAQSFKDFILKKIKSQMPSMVFGRKMIFMVESIPEDLILNTATLISHSLMENEDLNLIIKIAKKLTDNWSIEGRNRARSANWLTVLDNLAYYRNEIVPADKYSVIILYGSDVVTDSSSLADFNHCSLKMVWEDEMLHSFSLWIRDKLTSKGINIFGKDEMQKYDNILLPIIEHGRADLSSISKWLENLDISYCEDSSDVLEVILNNLQAFNLPQFSGFPYNKTQKEFSPYVHNAIEFFNYTMFIEDSKKKKVEGAIDKIMDAMQTKDGEFGNLEEERIRGNYSSGKEFLHGMKNYILTADPEERDRLMHSDFVFISDKILKYREKKQKQKSSTKKLEGSPVEMVLTAIWDSLLELSKPKSSGLVEDIVKIELIAELFKHDMEWDDGEMYYSTQEVSEAAAQFLYRLVGGLDVFVMRHICIKNKDGVEIAVSSKMYSDDLKYRYSSVSISELIFYVKLYIGKDDSPQERQYAWKLPPNHSYRLATDLINMVADELDSAKHACTLPFFHLPYYDEILTTVDNEELKSVFLHSIRDSASGDTFIKNMLSASWLTHEDKLLPHYRKLAEEYHHFIRAARKDGLIAALADSSKWEVLRQRYEDVLELISTDENILKSPMAGMALRAFMVIRERYDKSEAWYGDAHEQSCVVTILHPSLLEMLQSQMVYQISCFNYAVKAGMDEGKSLDAFKKQIWQSYLDLAHIRMPINCILVDAGKNLITNVVGHELIHKVGNPNGLESLKSTKLLLSLDHGSDDELAKISDADMFLETRESKLLYNLMIDYFLLHPHARDGISLAVYRNQDIQPIIAAIHAYLKELSDPKKVDCYVIKPRRYKRYIIRLTIFTESADNSGIARWIEQYKEIWEAAETDDKYKMYRNCKFSISYRMINSADQNSFLKMINDNFSADVSVLYDIIGSGTIADKFETVDPMDIRTHSLKYPILEKAMATIDNPADKFKRFRIISNRQFGISSKLAGCMHALKNMQPPKGTVVMSTGDLNPWMKAIREMHARSEWVICIDPSVDDRLIRDSGKKDGLQRDIIGFGSGVGVSGEENYTISTEQFSLKDIEIRLKASIKNLIADHRWDEAEYQLVTSKIMNVASEISGLSLVRATGVADQYIRDLMAYSLTRILIGQNQDILCDNLITLDAYRHWFDFAKSGNRPDLLWLRAQVGAKNRLYLDLHLIECKMGNESEKLLLKAHKQINNGLSVLVNAFKPIDPNANKLDDNKPDRRYWWMQLHRLIAAKAKINAYQEQDVISALEKLAEGDYEISWSASVMAFWIDDEQTIIKKSGSWPNDNLSSGWANVFSIGKNYIRKLAQLSEEATEMIADIKDLPIEDEVNVMLQIQDIDISVSLADEEPQTIDISADWEDDEETDSAPNWESDSAANWESDSAPVIQDLQRTDDVSISAKMDDAGSLEFADNRYEQLNIPQRILLGKTVEGKEVYWEFGHENLANRHMVIFGTSGMGKTYAIQCILCELARQNQNSLVIDYTDGFIPSNIETAAKQYITDTSQEYIYNEPLPINPFKAQVSEEGGMTFSDSPLTIARRVSSIFKNVYDLGSQQHPLTAEVIEKGVDKYGDDFNLDKMMKMLHSYIDHELYSKNIVSTTITKLRPFISSKPFLVDNTEYGWHKLFTDTINKCRIFQFHKVDKHSSRAIIEFVLWDLYNYVSSYGGKNQPKVIVLDEIQNLDLGPDAPVSKYLTEGRKHGLSLITATQTVKGVGGVSDAKLSRLFQAELKMFFKPTENEMREHAQLLHNAISDISLVEWRNRLAKLQKGECLILGRHLVESTGELKLMPHKVKISSLEDRGFNG